jgi:septal ring factor EnvC (AmiA/AmiB activator)
MRRLPADRVTLLLALLLLPISGIAQKAEDPLLKRQRELRDLKREMEENRAKISELQRKERNLGDLEGRLRRDRNMTTRYISELERQERDLLRDLEERQDQLDRRTTEHKKVADLLRQRLRLYRRNRRPQTAELLLSSQSFPDLFRRGTLLARAIQRDRSDLLWLQELREELAQETSLLETRRRGLETLQSEKLREMRHLESQSKQTRAEIAEVRKAREAFEKRQRELVESEKKIQSFIARLEEEIRSKGRLVGPGLDEGRGRLPWPSRGEIISRFGYDTHPRFGTKVPNKGIDIAAPEGTPIRAVAGGVAEFVDWLSGYGRCVILNHGMGYYTLYAHCKRVLVAQGMAVEQGQQIAEVGDTDSVKGSCLHFEIRYRENALDPEDWLK